MPTDDVRARREKVVLDHFHDEVEQDWDAVLSTFPHPRYEIVPTQTVHDGDAAVRGYYHETRVAFPDQRHEMIALRHCDDAVVVEFYLLGTHRGPLGPVPPTGGSFKVRMTASSSSTRTRSSSASGSTSISFRSCASSLAAST